MLFLGIGLVMLFMWSMDMDPVAAWPWWVIAIPFGLTVLWWFWSDKSGYTKRKEMELEDAKREERIERNREAMGMLSAKKRKRR